jgi:PTH1 family peptidyl-tRNA hydrolase
MSVLITGLGNKGYKYKNTLHNAGHIFIDWLVAKYPAGNVLCCKGESLVLAKTSCFMNDSGADVLRIYRKVNLGFTLKGETKSVGAFPDFFLVHDDIDIPFGKYKITFGNASGGHKGVQSVIDALGTKDFWRIRVGVQPPSYSPKVDKAEDWVLREFTEEQLSELSKVFFKIKKSLSVGNF